MSRGLQILIGLSLLVLAVAFAVYLIFVRPVEKAIQAGEQTAVHGIDKSAEVLGKIPGIIAKVFQSRVSVSTSATICDATPIAELAVLQRNIREVIDYENTDYYSTKRIVAEQTFVAKIGFDLQARFSATFDPSNNLVTISLPNPKVLSLEPSNPAPKYYVEDSGILNWLTTEDHQQILIALKEHAAHDAESALAVGDAKQMIETRFQDLFQAFNVNVKVVFPEDQTNILGKVSETPK